MRCPNCQELLTETDDGEFYCFECGKAFYLRDIPTETPPEQPEQDDDRKELELLIL